ncbi:zf-HC2 domain-containing protein [Nocardiopsis rhodophaea]|uniref:zf-HC2 domain-containing protein n=1 Tax=Nocardiopsis rhodophaea TaxID=280238 RepID=UPI0031D72D7A
MSGTRHQDGYLLGAYVLGTLDPQESAVVERHAADCAECRDELAGLREMKETLGDLPPEAMLTGPPEGGDLLLQRTLRSVREERASAGRRRRVLVSVAAAAAAAVLVGGGVVAGRSMGLDVPPQTAPSPSAPTEPPDAPEGTVTVSGEDPVTGVNGEMTIEPAKGWVRVNAAISGIPAGEKCRLVVVGKNKEREVAGSWLTSAAGEEEATTLDAAALIAPENVEAVEVWNFEGDRFLRVEV